LPPPSAAKPAAWEASTIARVCTVNATCGGPVGVGLHTCFHASTIRAAIGSAAWFLETKWKLLPICPATRARCGALKEQASDTPDFCYRSSGERRIPLFLQRPETPPTRSKLELALADPMSQLKSSQSNRRCPIGFEAHHGSAPALDRPMILFDDWLATIRFAGSCRWPWWPERRRIASSEILLMNLVASGEMSPSLPPTGGRAGAAFSDTGISGSPSGLDRRGDHEKTET
jgi:hypothetical protein